MAASCSSRPRPHVTRVALVFNPAQRAVRRPVPAAGRGRGALLLGDADRGRWCASADDLDRGVRCARARSEWGTDSAVGPLHGQTIAMLLIALAAHHRLPAVYPFRYFATAEV